MSINIVKMNELSIGCSSCSGEFFGSTTVSPSGATTTTGISNGAGSVISGTIQGAASIYSAMIAADQAEEDRKAAAAKHNADTELNVDQLNMNQDRLAEMASVSSGAALRNDENAIAAFNSTNANTDWQSAYDQAASEGGLGDNIVNADMYKDSQLQAARDSAKATSYDSLKSQGSYSTLDANNYKV